MWNSLFYTASVHMVNWDDMEVYLQKKLHNF